MQAGCQEFESPRLHHRIRGIIPEDTLLAPPAGARVTVQRITIPPGHGTGVHWHGGQALVIVLAGRLTHRAPGHPGGTRLFVEGEVIVEGPGYLHEGWNDGAEPVVLWAVHLTPEGRPLAAAWPPDP